MTIKNGSSTDSIKNVNTDLTEEDAIRNYFKLKYNSDINVLNLNNFLTKNTRYVITKDVVLINDKKD